ncbi:MAG: type I methionyl aminopeptidase [Clostridiales bacterium]|nr:type I methionyl aminopeptidase [Clostridiales bacterium]
MSERITLKSPHQIELMRQAGRLAAMARAYGGSLVQPGITTREIDHEIGKFIKSHGGYPSCYHLYGFKGNACISVNDEIIHGVPSGRKLKEGDIVSIDLTACVGDYRLDSQGVAVGGYHGDCCATFPCGEISEEARRLIEGTERAFWAGFRMAVAGNHVSDISKAVQTSAEGDGYSLVREYTGHGIGRSVHEAPEVPNYVSPRTLSGSPRLYKNMVICVEPMVNAGSARIRNRRMPDGWEVPMTADGKLAAHYENTILITEGEPEILTRCGD